MKMVTDFIKRHQSLTCQTLTYKPAKKTFGRLRSKTKVSPFYNVAFIGDKNVGKTSIIRQHLSGEFIDEYFPTVSDVFTSEIKKKDQLTSTLNLYDTSGSMEFPAMMRLTITKSDACVVVYAVTSLASLRIAKQKLSEIKAMKGDGFPCILIGNKTEELKREVSFEMGLRCAVSYACSYAEVSAKENKNIDQLFDTVVKKIRQESVAKFSKPKEIRQRSKSLPSLFDV